ncbi:TraR/DksA C4-type zinc finger protein [Leucobacter sp. Psy1]|uniref:TraR/DksA family transcriptional regulator n=1 Tax=Leucobacter sp. Psy1 TaxID=2875729 RepID=UPI001CD22913|nr:TraR/DksA C4-type zinc finger protein [Leucobacter sp. Psy1]
MSGPSRADLMLLREAAQEREARTRAALAALTRDRIGETDDDEHDPEGVTLSSEWSRLHGLLEAAIDESEQSAAALARWDACTYGVCVDCGRDIPEARLEARPFADRCVPCAERAGL